MARRKNRQRPIIAHQPALKDVIGRTLPKDAITKPTTLTLKGRPVVWHDGILYCDGRAIGRRPKP